MPAQSKKAQVLGGVFPGAPEFEFPPRILKCPGNLVPFTSRWESPILPALWGPNYVLAG